MDENFIRERITELRMLKGVSEYQMSYDLAKNKNYIGAIASGKSLPSVPGLLSICEYFDMTPAQFFDREYPAMAKKAAESMESLDDEDMLLLCNIIQRFSKKK